MNTNTIIDKVRKAFHKMKLIEGAARVRAKTEAERGAAEIELIMDDVRAEGIDPMSPMGLTCITEIWKARQAVIAREVHAGERDPLNGGFPHGW